MSGNLFAGQKVRLAAIDPEHDAPLAVRWSRDPEFLQMLSTGIARPWSVAAMKKEMEESLGDGEPKPGRFPFHICTLAAEDQPSRLIGFVDLVVDYWSHREGWIGIGIGERTDWSKGYGSDAMRLIVRYAFAELNLRRVSLSVFDYNQRGLRAYRKLGFVEEGRMRQYLHRYGRRWDMVFMGLLREEWEASV
jgi:RimJ/RimL family protein N-acetyltransferase